MILWRVRLLPSFDWWANSSMLTPVPTFWWTLNLHPTFPSYPLSRHQSIQFTNWAASLLSQSHCYYFVFVHTVATSTWCQTSQTIHSYIGLTFCFASICLSVYIKPVSENQSNSEHCQNYICWHRLPWGSLFLSLLLPCHAVSCKISLYHSTQWKSKTSVCLKSECR